MIPLVENTRGKHDEAAFATNPEAGASDDQPIEHEGHKRDSIRRVATITVVR